MFLNQSGLAFVNISKIKISVALVISNFEATNLQGRNHLLVKILEPYQ